MNSSSRQNPAFFADLAGLSLCLGLLAFPQGAQASAEAAQASGLSEVRSELKSCLVRLVLKSPRTGRPIRNVIQSRCESIHVDRDWVKSRRWESRVIAYRSKDGNLWDLALWGERGELLLESNQLPAGRSPLDALVTALDIASEIRSESVDAATISEVLP